MYNIIFSICHLVICMAFEWTPTRLPPAVYNWMSQVPLTPQTLYPVHNTFSLSDGPCILTPSLSWSPNFATPHTPVSSFPTYPRAQSPSTGFHTFPSSSLQHVLATASHSQKRKLDPDKNLPIFESLDASAKKWKCPLSPKAKILIVFSTIKNDASCSFSDFLFHVFNISLAIVKSLFRSFFAAVGHRFGHLRISRRTCMYMERNPVFPMPVWRIASLSDCLGVSRIVARGCNIRSNSVQIIVS